MKTRVNSYVQAVKRAIKQSEKYHNADKFIDNWQRYYLHRQQLSNHREI